MQKTLIKKKVFITGADGFIGSHLVELLNSQGADVTALIFYNSWNSKGWLEHIPKEIKKKTRFVYGDIRDFNLMKKFIKNSEYVFHLASLIAIPYSYDAPASYIETNVLGTLNILEACKQSDKLERLIHISTSETYGTAQYTPIDERHPLVGQSPYSASKIAADKIVESFYLSYNLPVVTARPFNTYGPRQTSRAIIPTIASQLVNRKDIIKLGTLSPKRDFNYVSDTCNALIEIALTSNIEGEVINIGNNKEISIEDILMMLINISGYKPKILLDESRVRPKKSEVFELIADNTKISKLTNWKPNVKLSKGLSLTYDWIRDNIKFFNTDEFAK